MRLVRYSTPYRTLAPAFGALHRSPWSGLDSEIDRLFATALNGFAGQDGAQRFPVDLFEDKANTYVRAELPGLNRADINVEVVDGQLTIAATRKTPAVEGQPEESYSFRRSVSLADDVQTDQVAAAYENGVLTVTLPKREAPQPKKITVAVK